MATDITSYTTNEEVSAIYAYYTNEDGTVNYDAIATAIEANDTSAGNIEDLITAYVSGTGQLTPVMMSPEGYISSPDDYSWLWTADVVSNLQQLGDLYGNADGTYDSADMASIVNFLNYGGSLGAVDSGLLNDVGSFISEYGSDSTSNADDVYNLFNTSDLSEVMSLFLNMGNPGIALLMYSAYGLGPQMRDLQEAAVGVMNDSADEVDDLLSDLQDIDPSDPSASYDSEAVQQQLNVVSTVLSTMTEFVKNAQDAIDEMVQLASDLSEQTNRTIDSVVRNIS